ncbi:hypothetical protein WMY93_033829 [Mugilogobius chulae]|uniref:Uncharacterized protein n=1 Tax=Mugilogobius chulae TaxID=88201 RepID=A0AAW0MGA3_9GOBI
MLVPPHVAPEDALEWFFDRYIADEPPTEEEERKRKREENEEEEENVSQPGVRGPLEEHKLLYWKDFKLKNSEESGSTSASAAVFEPVISVVCSASLNCALDLRKIVLNGRNVVARKRFVQMRIRSPRATASVSANGRLLCAGTPSVDDAHKAARRFARIIQKLGFPVSFSHFRIINFVLTYHTFPLRLALLYVALRCNCSYEPELFNGLIFHSGQISACVFYTGTVFLTGKVTHVSVNLRTFIRTKEGLKLDKNSNKSKRVKT